MNIYDQLYKTFAEQNGMLEREILALGYTKQDIEDTLEENKFEEITYDIGLDIGKVYTFVRYLETFNKYVKMSIDQQLALRYLLGERLQYGYFDNFSAVVGIGASDQYLNEVDICTTLITEKTTVLGINITPIKQLEYESGYYYMYKLAFEKYLKAFDIKPTKVLKYGVEIGILDVEKLYSLIEDTKTKELLESVLRGE